MKKFFPRKTRPDSTKRAVALFEDFCRHDIFSSLVPPRPVPSSCDAIRSLHSRSKTENSLHPRSSAKFVVKTHRCFLIENRQSKFENPIPTICPQPKTLNQEPSEKLQLLALSCTYLQLLAPNCSSRFFSGPRFSPFSAPAAIACRSAAPRNPQLSAVKRTDPQLTPL